jgi:alanine racemase
MVPIGYHDGIFRSIKNGTVSIEGVRCPIVGAVSMDSMAVDVTDAPGADVGSDVLVFGTYGGSTVPIQDLAQMMGTIPHEVLAAIGPRVQRVFSRH